MKDFLYKFISEQPISEELQFGHKELLQTLKNISIRCETPFTIGLFGKWGSGKSSIAANLRRELLESGVPLILFDVWKHEGDALRRTFLKESVKQLTEEPYGANFFRPNFKLSDRIDGAFEKKRMYQVTLDLKSLWPFIRQLGLIVLLITTGLFIVKVAVEYLFPVHLESYSQFVNTNFLSLGVIASVLAWIFGNLKDFVNKSEINVSKDRIADPHDFEMEFNNILNNLQNRRIVIVFDNLDRIAGKTVLEVFSTIKTFLEPVDLANKNREVVFLIPCDGIAIRSQISQSVGGKESINDLHPLVHADEFLRKFFNTILWIPEFYGIELEQFALRKLTETKIAEFNNPHLAWLILQVFQQNPRQIIQFINVLISNYLLMREKSSQNSFGDKNFYKQNIPQLAKYLLLIQKFPATMEVYKSTKTYDLDVDLELEPSFLRFRSDTQDIKIHSLEPFFNFKISDSERSLPGVSRFFQNLEEGSKEDALVTSQDLKLTTQTEELSLVFRNYLAAKQNPISTFAILSTIFYVTNAQRFALNTSAYREIQKKFDHPTLTGIEKIFPSLLSTEFLKKEDSQFTVNPIVRKKIIIRWINILKEHASNANPSIDREFELSLLLTILDNDTDIDQANETALRAVIESRYQDDPVVWKIFIDHPSQSRFVYRGTVTLILNSLTINNTWCNDFLEKVELLKRVRKATNQSIDPTYLQEKISLFLSIETANQSDVEKKKEMCQYIQILIDLYPDAIKASQPRAHVLNTLTHSFELSKSKHIHLFIPLIAAFQSLNQIFAPLFETALAQFFGNVTGIAPKDIVYALKTTPSVEKLIAQDKYNALLESVIFDSPVLIFIFYNFTSDQNRARWVSRLRKTGRTKWFNHGDKEKFEKIGLLDTHNLLDIFSEA